MKAFHKSYVLWIFIVCFVLLMPNSAYAQSEAKKKKLKCEAVKWLLTKAELERRIFDIGTEAFPLEEIAEDDKRLNRKNDEYWRKKKENGIGCCVEDGGCAQHLGSLLAEITKENETDNEKLGKLLTFIHMILKQFKAAGFKTACINTYTTFIKMLHNENEYQRIKSFINISSFGHDYSNMAFEARCNTAIDRFEKIEKSIKEAIAKEIAEGDTSGATGPDPSGKDNGPEAVTSIAPPKPEKEPLGEENESEAVTITPPKIEKKTLGKDNEPEAASITSPKPEPKPDESKSSSSPELFILIVFIIAVCAAFYITFSRIRGTEMSNNKNIVEKTSSLEQMINGKISRIESDISKLKDDVFDLKTSPGKSGSNEQLSRQILDELNKKSKEIANQVSARIDERIKELQTDQTGQETDSGSLKNSIQGIGLTLKKINKQIKEFDDRLKLIEQKNIASAIIEIEHEILSNKWNTFTKENKELVNLAAQVGDSDEKDFYMKTVIINIPTMLANDEKLISRYNETLVPLKEYYSKLIKLVKLNDYFLKGSENPQPANKKESETEIGRLRNWSQLLAFLENSSEIHKILAFKPDQWIRKNFLEMADKLLCKYQEAGEQDKSLQNLYQVVVDVLSRADLKPVEIIPGKTHFDAKIHIARSTTTNNSLPDGIITGVIRNGFFHGERMIQQPEVIINKI